jgi:hypothetical protein
LTFQKMQTSKQHRHRHRRLRIPSNSSPTMSKIIPPPPEGTPLIRPQHNPSQQASDPERRPANPFAPPSRNCRRTSRSKRFPPVSEEAAGAATRRTYRLRRGTCPASWRIDAVQKDIPPMSVPQPSSTPETEPPEPPTSIDTVRRRGAWWRKRLQQRTKVGAAAGSGQFRNVLPRAAGSAFAGAADERPARRDLP